MVGWLVGWFDGCIRVVPGGPFVGSFFCKTGLFLLLVGWLVGLLVGWLVGWLVCLLGGWLVGWYL